MSIRTPSPSPFRPKDGVDQTILTENKELLAEIDRRKVLRGTLSLGALTLLSGCNVTSQSSVQQVLRAVSRWNDTVQAALFDPNKLAPTYSKEEVMIPPRFNAYYHIDKVKALKEADWKLEVSGLVDDKRSWTARQIYDLPEQEWIIRHICVEGWDYIGQWSGVNLKTFLQRIGADLSARYVVLRSADNYSSTIDMATALHPQTILATKYAGAPIGDPFGFPLRLRTSTKLGFKNAKWITALEVTNVHYTDYWEQRGFNWFAGL